MLNQQPALDDAKPGVDALPKSNCMRMKYAIKINPALFFFARQTKNLLLRRAGTARAQCGRSLYKSANLSAS